MLTNRVTGFFWEAFLLIQKSQSQHTLLRLEHLFFWKLFKKKIFNHLTDWAFVVSGALNNSDAVGTGYRISVTNQRTGATISDAISSDGTFAAVTADLSRKSIVELNDTLKVVVVDAQGKVVSGPYTFKVTPEALEKAYLHVTLPVNEMIP